MDLVQNLLIKIQKLSMDLVHDRESMDPVHKSGPWTRSKEGVGSMDPWSMFCPHLIESCLDEYNL